jgi:hypothetical protein
MNYSIAIKPSVEHSVKCHACGMPVQANGVLWQGIHACGRFECQKCGGRFIEDLPVGHAMGKPCRLDSQGKLVSGAVPAPGWFCEPLRRSLNAPDSSDIQLKVQSRRHAKRIVLLICIDSLYGHCLLKLLNASRHLRDPEFGLVILVPQFLAWMAPDGIAELWTTDIPLDRAERYFPSLERRIGEELERFAEVRLSKAISHPIDFQLADYTRVQRHNLAAEDYRITFIWRADRLWLQETLPMRACRKLGLHGLLLAIQRRKIVRALERIRHMLPEATPTVAGLGRQGTFPSWIEDCRTQEAADADAERSLCRVYAESRVVIGVHGSNMLLPSGHAGMCVDLMPSGRWPNIAQDILFPGEARHDARMIAFQYRFLPIATTPDMVAQVITAMVRKLRDVSARFVSEVYES